MSTPGPIPDHRVEVVIESSWLMIGLASLGAVLGVIGSIALFVAQGVTVVSVIVALLALGLVAVVVFDLPLSARFDADGVERRALLRRHTLPWVRVRRLSRLRSGIYRTFRAEVRGGLVADVRGRSYLLVDRTESAIEFDELRRILGENADRLGVNESLRPGYENPDAWSVGGWFKSRTRRRND